jgi:hypothetical protein
LARDLGVNLGLIYGRRGKHYLDSKIVGYNRAARFSPWLVLRDMDHDVICPVSLRVRLLAAPEPHMCFRIAVRSVETWLLADSRTLAAFFRISASLVPRDPEFLDDPKGVLVNLARRSTRSAIHEEVVPRRGSSRSEGPAYVARMTEFVNQRWQPELASRDAERLYRIIQCLKRLLAGT